MESIIKNSGLIELINNDNDGLESKCGVSFSKLLFVEKMSSYGSTRVGVRRLLPTIYKQLENRYSDHLLPNAYQFRKEESGLGNIYFYKVEI